MIEITQERSEQFIKMFKYLVTRGYKIEYTDNSFSMENGIQYITYPCSFQLITLSNKSSVIAELKQDKGIFSYKEF